MRIASPVASTWMGSVSVGKKRSELQKGDMFTKSQKRASPLISDAAGSLFATLTSPSPSTPSASLPMSTSTSSISPPPVHSRSFEEDNDGLALDSLPISPPKPLTPSRTSRLQPKSQTTQTPKQASSKSVLDNDNDWKS
ncbi:hypothetical protein C8Q76DRAFT_791315 [Earliella scabrosa]|nr:hypothetical protein C8Q76DRAFT_791315 [Earliella scabrosa]